MSMRCSDWSGRPSKPSLCRGEVCATFLFRRTRPSSWRKIEERSLATCCCVFLRATRLHASIPLRSTGILGGWGWVHAFWRRRTKMQPVTVAGQFGSKSVIMPGRPLDCTNGRAIFVSGNIPNITKSALKRCVSKSCFIRNHAAVEASALDNSGSLHESLLAVDIASGAVAKRFESGYEESCRARL